MTQTTAPTKQFGPRQAQTAKSEAEMVWLWSLDLTKAVEENDLVKVQALTACMSQTLVRLGDLAKRAAK